MTGPNPQEGWKHTPGPWSFDYGTVPPDGPGTYADIYVDGGDTIIAHFNNQIPEGLANARLIAAAPALLKALRGAIGALEFSRDYHSDLGNEEQAFCQDKLDAAHKAIAQATGGENGR